MAAAAVALLPGHLPAQSTKKPAIVGTRETGSGNRRKTAGGTVITGSANRGKRMGVVDQGRTRRGRRLTTRERRIFVLGLGASEKN